jgi:hypothetical protein
MQPVSTVLQKRKTAIAVTAAHSDSIVSITERNNRCDDEINRAWRNKRFGNWLPNTEKISFKFGVRSKMPKNHIVAHVEYWSENALFCAPCALDNDNWVNFVINGQIACNAFAGNKLVRVCDALADLRRRVITHFIRE